MLRRELAGDPDGVLVSGTKDERVPAWGKIAREYTYTREGILYSVEGAGGVFWCSHCATWRPWSEGCDDTEERTLGPVCDHCVAAAGCVPTNTKTRKWRTITVRTMIDFFKGRRA